MEQNLEPSTADAKVDVGTRSRAWDYQLLRERHNHYTTQHAGNWSELDIGTARYTDNLPKIEIDKFDGNPLKFC